MIEAIPDSANGAGSSASTGRIGFLLQRAHHRLREQMLAALEGSGLHLGHIAILAALVESEGLTQRALVERTGIEKSSMVLFIDSLERDGLALRAHRPGDRRAHNVMLTAEGARQLAILGPKLAATEEAFLSALSATDRAAFAAMLARLDRPEPAPTA
jgi:DNA-binding MarR family transcriptional regulator